ncbi:MAG TPA: FHA domain-containing protein, partial [Pyrinomonadaceae bacterium]|nr:FHA domain-containing protein [Pyrinomonadaceae bacterium]
MIIVLAEIQGEQKLPAREFKESSIKIGRDQQRCNLVFDGTRWPMVSRLHAEMRVENGRCYLTDRGSTHGTFLNGQRLGAATEINLGARIQFGVHGPILSLEALKPDPPPAQDFSQTMVDSAATHLKEKLRAQTQQQNQAQPAPTLLQPQTEVLPAVPPLAAATQAFPKSMPMLVFEGGPGAEPGRQFLLTKDVTLLGRDASADIEIDIGAAAVSRHHAEVRRLPDGSFQISDLKSFNGTLRNQQRIAQPEKLNP